MREVLFLLGRDSTSTLSVRTCPTRRYPSRRPLRSRTSASSRLRLPLCPRRLLRAPGPPAHRRVPPCYLRPLPTRVASSPQSTNTRRSVDQCTARLALLAALTLLRCCEKRRSAAVVPLKMVSLRSPRIGLTHQRARFDNARRRPCLHRKVPQHQRASQGPISSSASTRTVAVRARNGC